MATIVQHKETKVQYVLVGAGFGAFQSQKPNWLFGDLVADTSEGTHAMSCICNAQGDLLWIESMQLIVVSVDGQRPVDLLASN